MRRQSALVLTAALLILAGGAEAHPHLRFAYQIEPLFEAGGRLGGLHVLWRMDALTTMLVSRGIDANRNGEVDADELDAFAKENGRLLAASGYFLRLTTNDRPLAFSLAAPLRARITEDGMMLAFEVRFDATAASGPLELRFFDETWYVALSAADPVLAGSTRCTSQPRMRLLATQGWGHQPVASIELDCEPRGAAQPAAWR